MSGGRFQGDLPERTFQFALMVLSLVDEIPDGTKGWVLGKQLARSGTSIGANIREADHALSDAEFVQRCSIARKEASETQYWLMLCKFAHLLHSTPAFEAALSEADELMRILSTVVKRSQSYAKKNSITATRRCEESKS